MPHLEPSETTYATVATLKPIPSEQEESEWSKLQATDGEFADLVTFMKTDKLPTVNSDAKQIILRLANFSLLV